MIIRLLDAGADHNIARLDINNSYADSYLEIFDKIVKGWKERVKKMVEAKGANIPGEQQDTSDERQKYNGMWVHFVREMQGDIFGRGTLLA